MQTLITSGKATVVASGSVFSFNDMPIEIKLLDIEKEGMTYNLKFSFSYDTNDHTARWIIGKDNSNTCYHLELINYNNPLGTGILSPIMIATIGSNIFYYITFMVNCWIKTLSKQFSYTIYRIEESK